MEIQLNLEHHCIQTACKKLYNLSISQYFKPDADLARLEALIPILQAALETFDFGYLRKTYPELNGKSGKDISLFYNDAGKIGLKIDHHTILSHPRRIKSDALHP